MFLKDQQYNRFSHQPVITRKSKSKNSEADNNVI